MKLYRLYEPEKGRILIDGYDLRSFNLVLSVVKLVSFLKIACCSRDQFATTLH